MAKTKISEFSATPSSNTDIDGINIAEGCAPSGINNAIRELMSQLKDFQAGTAGDSFNGPIGTTTAAAGVFTNLSASGTLGVTGVATLGNGAILGTPASVTLTNATGLPIATGVSGLGTGVATALAVNVGSAGAPVVNGGALGTPSSGTVTNLTGTASININGTVGATTASTGAFTTLTTSSTVTHNAGTANGVAYLNGSKVLTTGSALTFDGTNFLLASGGRIRNIPTTTTANALFQSSNDGGGFYTGIEDSTGSLFTGAAYAGLVWHTGNRPIAFGVNNGEQMRLTSTGLGIGTSSPGSLLDVAGSIRATGLFQRFNNSGLSLSGGPVFNTDGAGISLRGVSAAFNTYGMEFYAGGSERMRLDSSGNLGLGVTPSAWSGYTAFDIARGSLFGAGSETYLSHNAFWNGSSWRYKATDFATNYRSNNGAHAWSTAPSGTAGNAISFTQAMTLDASGNLVIGATSPTSGYMLDVTGKINTQNRYAINGRDTIAREDSGKNIIVGDLTGLSDSYITFRTVNSERARIDSSGNLLVGTTTAGLSDSKGIDLNNQYGVVYTNHTTGQASGAQYAIFGYAGSLIGSITQNGTTGVAYNTSSDYRLKNTIAPMTGALAKVALLKPCTYKWNADGSNGEGFIAHELAEVVPQCVTGQKDAVDAEGKPQYQGIDTSFLVATVVAALQELKAEFDAYKASHP
jgi:hypothetical protein